MLHEPRRQTHHRKLRRTQIGSTKEKLDERAGFSDHAWKNPVIGPNSCRSVCCEWPIPEEKRCTCARERCQISTLIAWRMNSVTTLRSIREPTGRIGRFPTSLSNTKTIGTKNPFYGISGNSCVGTLPFESSLDMREMNNESMVSPINHHYGEATAMELSDQFRRRRSSALPRIEMADMAGASPTNW